jgi:hypothetical protein
MLNQTGGAAFGGETEKEEAKKIKSLLLLLFGHGAGLKPARASFWIAKLCASGSFLPALPAILTSVLWVLALYGRFERKLSRSGMR